MNHQQLSTCVGSPWTFIALALRSIQHASMYIHSLYMCMHSAVLT